MRGSAKLVPMLTLLVLTLPVISMCSDPVPESTGFVLPSDALLGECLASECGPIIDRLVEQSEQDDATIRLLKIEIQQEKQTGGMLAAYWERLYEDERGTAVERLLKNYGPPVLFMLGVWVGATAVR